MLKDTKSLGNNKAQACESRGFVHKKGDVHFDTSPSCFFFIKSRNSLRKASFKKNVNKNSGYFQLNLLC